MAKPPDKVAWNLSIPAEVKRAMEVYCAMTGQNISELTESLWRDLLKNASEKPDDVIARVAESSPDDTGPRPDGKPSKRIGFELRSQPTAAHPTVWVPPNKWDSHQSKPARDGKGLDGKAKPQA